MCEKYYITNGNKIIGETIENNKTIYKEIPISIMNAAKFKYIEAQNFISLELDDDVNWSVQKIFSDVNRKNYIITNASNFAANDCTITNNFLNAKSFNSINDVNKYIRNHKEIVRCFEEIYIINGNFEQVKETEIIDSQWKNHVVNKSHIKKNIRNSIYHKSGHICYICGKPLSYSEMTIDHIIPVSRGGDNNPGNLRCVCSECNKLKGNRLDKEMYRGLVGICSLKAYEDPDDDSWDTFIRAKVRGEINKYVGG